MKSVILLKKPLGISPLDAIKLFQEKNLEYQNTKLGVAGRLDPMAEGLLVVLVGDENKKRKDYERLPKEYKFIVLFGIETDSYDLLGKITGVNLELDQNEIHRKVEEFVKENRGKKIQEYPPYSSPHVNGKPLFWWAREGKLSEIEIPKKEIEIFKFELDRIKNIEHDELIDLITYSILKVNGVFRQEEILKGWIEFFKENSAQTFMAAEFTISCSSGTYVRSIAHEMGRKIGSGAIAQSILRTKVGDYSLDTIKNTHDKFIRVDKQIEN